MLDMHFVSLRIESTLSARFQYFCRFVAYYKIYPEFCYTQKKQITDRYYAKQIQTESVVF